MFSEKDSVYAAVVTTEEITGIRFDDSNTNPLHAYQDGKEYSLQEAYDRGPFNRTGSAENQSNLFGLLIH